MFSILLAALLAAPGITQKRPSQAPVPIAGDQQVQPNENLSADEVRQHVEGYLGSIDTPITANQWKALGPRAVPMLERIATNQNELPTRRAKAIGGLAALGDTRGPALFKRIASQDSEAINVRFAAVRGLAQVTPPAQAVTNLKPILQGAKDSRVRALAAEQIAVRSRGKSCDLVKAQLDRETNDARGHYGRAMKQCAMEK
jgi:HEAT repeat protein